MHTRGPWVAIAAAVGSWFCPGLGAGLIRRERAMFLWIGAAAAVLLSVAISIWLLPLVFALHFAAAFDAYRAVRAADRAGVQPSWIGPVIAVVLNMAVPIAIRATALEAFRIPSSSQYPTLEIGDHIFVDKLTPRFREIERGELIVFIQPCQPERDYIERVIALAGETVEVRCSVVYVDGKPLPAELVQGETCSYLDRNEMTGEWSRRGCSEYREITGSHSHHIFHDPDRPARDAKGSARATGDVHDFPVVDSARRPPSCAGVGEDLPGQRELANPLSQLPGSLVETKHDAGPCESQLHYVVPPDHVFVMGDSRDNSNDSRYWGSVPRAAIKGRVIGIWATIRDGSIGLRRFGSVE